MTQHCGEAQVVVDKHCLHTRSFLSYSEPHTHCSYCVVHAVPSCLCWVKQGQSAQLFVCVCVCTPRGRQATLVSRVGCTFSMEGDTWKAVLCVLVWSIGVRSCNLSDIFRSLCISRSNSSDVIMKDYLNIWNWQITWDQNYLTWDYEMAWWSTNKL